MADDGEWTTINHRLVVTDGNAAREGVAEVRDTVPPERDTNTHEADPDLEQRNCERPESSPRGSARRVCHPEDAGVIHGSNNTVYRFCVQIRSADVTAQNRAVTTPNRVHELGADPGGDDDTEDSRIAR